MNKQKTYHHSSFIHQTLIQCSRKLDLRFALQFRDCAHCLLLNSYSSQAIFMNYTDAASIYNAPFRALPKFGKCLLIFALQWTLNRGEPWTSRPLTGQTIPNALNVTNSPDQTCSCLEIANTFALLAHTSNIAICARIWSKLYKPTLPSLL